MNDQIPETHRSYWTGVSCIVVSWMAAAIINSCMVALNRKGFSAEELLYLRSFGCIMVALIAGTQIFRMNGLGHKSCLTIAASSILFYEAIAQWDRVNPVIAIVALMPIVNIYLARRDGNEVPLLAYISAILLLGGIVWALNPFTEPMSLIGIILALACTVVSALGFNMWSKTDRTVTLWHKGFWLGVYVNLLAVIVMMGRQAFHLTKDDPVPSLVTETAKYFHVDPRTYLVGFTIFATIYIYFSIVPFTAAGKMNIVHASILTQGATPASFIGSWLILHEEVARRQVPGLACALVGTVIVTFQLARPKPAIVPATRSG